MTATGARYAEADPVYGLTGQSAAVQAAQWVKLANSLRARAAMRISQANATKARAELTAALAGPVLASNARQRVRAVARWRALQPALPQLGRGFHGLRRYA